MRYLFRRARDGFRRSCKCPARPVGPLVFLGALIYGTMAKLNLPCGQTTKQPSRDDRCRKSPWVAHRALITSHTL